MTLGDLGAWISGLWTCRRLRQAVAGHADALQRLERALDERQCGPAFGTACATNPDGGVRYGRRKDDSKL